MLTWYVSAREGSKLHWKCKNTKKTSFILNVDGADVDWKPIIQESSADRASLFKDQGAVSIKKKLKFN